MVDGEARRQPVLLTYLVKQLELAIRQDMDRSVRPAGLTTPQYTALSVLARHPGMSSAQLARRSFVSPQAANEMVAALERKGLIERHLGPDNQRVLVMELTPSGRDLLERCTGDVVALEARMVADLTPTATARLRTMLESCLAAVGSEGENARADPPPKGRGQGVGARANRRRGSNDGL